MSFIAGYLLGLEEHEPAELSITANGTYTAPAETCWNKVTANVPDRYNEGYAAGRASVRLGTKTAAVNGTYNASSDNFDGYSTFTVNVNDRYAEGYAAGYSAGVQSVALGSKTITANGTYYAVNDELSGYDVVTVNVPGYDEGYADGYADGYEEGSEEGGYTFPEGTGYPDIVALTGDSPVRDDDLGLTIIQSRNNGEESIFRVYAKDGNGNEYSIYYEITDTKTYISSKAVMTDVPNGTITIEYQWYYNGYPSDIRTSRRTISYSFLCGFGDSSHSYTVFSG